MSDLKKHALHRRNVLVMAGAALALAGCSGNIIGPPEASQIYVLHPAVPAAGAGMKVNWSLNVATPSASDSLDTMRIAITRGADRMDYYADAVWPDHLPTVVQGALVQGFEASGRIDQVAPDLASLNAHYLLQTEIRDFEARYDQPDGIPTVVVRLAVNLVEVHGHRLVAHTLVTQQVAATQNNVDASVDAFNRALGAAVGQVVTWALDNAPPVRGA